MPALAAIVTNNPTLRAHVEENRHYDHMKAAGEWMQKALADDTGVGVSCETCTNVSTPSAPLVQGRCLNCRTTNLVRCLRNEAPHELSAECDGPHSIGPEEREAYLLALTVEP